MNRLKTELTEYTSHYENGQLLLREFRKNGMLEGTRATFNENGQVATKGSY